MRKPKYSIEFFKKLGSDNGYELLSTIYHCRKLIFKCPKHNHIWNTRPDSVLKNQWCRLCWKESSRKYSLNDCINYAIERGGKCLSTFYESIEYKLSWQCHNNHLFEMTLDSVKRGHWCHTCSFSISQRICQEYFETLFKKKFPSKRIKILEGLELDGYCSELGLAFEHQGEQHYKLCNAFNMTEKSFQDLKERDIKKLNLCKQYGITLIIIPQLFRICKIENLKSLIKEECLKQNFKIPSWYDTTIVSITNSYKNKTSTFYLDRVREKAKLFNGEVLSLQYINAHSKIKYLCNKHKIVFESIPNSIILGMWGCPKCKAEKQIKSLKKTFEKRLSNIPTVIIS